MKFSAGGTREEKRRLGAGNYAAARSNYSTNADLVPDVDRFIDPDHTHFPSRHTSMQVFLIDFLLNDRRIIDGFKNKRR